MRFALPSRGAGRRLSGRRRAALLTAALLLLAGVGAWFLTTPGSAAVRYRTTSATLGTVEQTVGLSGNLTPQDESNLDFGVTSKVTAVDVSVGQTVSSGQVLATEDTTTLQTQLAQAQANLAAAQAKLAVDQQSSGQSLSQDLTQLSNDRVAAADTATLDDLSVNQACDSYETDMQASTAVCAYPSSYPPEQSPLCTSSSNSNCQKDFTTYLGARFKAQQDSNSSSAQIAKDQAAYQNASLGSASSAAQVLSDQASIATAQSGLTTIQQEVASATLTAPTNGEVAEVNVTVGQQVTAANSTGGASSAASSSTTHDIVILTPGLFSVTGDISDAQISEIASGQRALVTPAGGGDTLTAHVTAVAAVATISSGVATYAVTVSIDQPDMGLRDGMSATVSVVVNEVSQVLTVPTSAVHTTAAGSFVDVLVKGVLTQQAVTIGAADATRTQILSGLNAGDTVVLATVSATAPTTGAGGGFGLGGFGGGGGRRAPGG
ncbi:MAG: efflux RND transporter periplasmic adaptor subunit [Candidatus Dormibacteria bacterium]